MKILKWFVGVLLIITFVFSMAGCSKTGLTKESAKDQIDTNIPDKLQDPNFLILINVDPPGDVMLESFAIFEEKYGGRVTYVSAPMGAIMGKLIAMVAGGDAPDITYWMQSNMPKYKTSNVLQPINEYINLKDPIWDIPSMEAFKYGDSYYGVDFSVTPHFIFFNKTMFENNGIKTPKEYYKEGNWNWQTFREVAMKLTQDTNGDGGIDQWGYNSNHYWHMLAANDVDFLCIKDDGRVELNMGEPKLIEALQFFQDSIYTDKYYKPSGHNKQAKFDLSEGRIGMLPAGKAFVTGEDFLQNMKDEWDIAPYPCGPSNKDGKQPAFAAYLGIPTGAKNPQTAGVFLYMFTKHRKDRELERLSEFLSNEQIELIKEIEKNIIIMQHQGILNQSLNKLWNDLKKGVPVLTAIDKYTPEFQAEIDSFLQNE